MTQDNNEATDNRDWQRQPATPVYRCPDCRAVGWDDGNGPCWICKSTADREGLPDEGLNLGLHDKVVLPSEFGHTWGDAAVVAVEHHEAYEDMPKFKLITVRREDGSETSFHEGSAFHRGITRRARVRGARRRRRK